MWGKTAILGFLGMEGVLKQTIPELNVEVYSLLRGQLPEDKLELNAFLGHSLIINIDDIQNLLNSPCRKVKIFLPIPSLNSYF